MANLIFAFRFEKRAVLARKHFIMEHQYELKKHPGKTKNVVLVLFFILICINGYGANNLRSSPNGDPESSKNIQERNGSVSALVQPIGLMSDIQIQNIDTNTTELKLVFADNTKPRYFILKKPTRLVVDIPNGQLNGAVRPEVFNGSLIKSVRQGAQPHQVLRLVFDLQDGVDVSQSMMGPKTLILRLKDTPLSAVKSIPNPIVSTTDRVAPITANKTQKLETCTSDSMRIENIQVKNIDTNTSEIEFIFASAPKFRYFTLENPMRFAVDIPDGCLEKPIEANSFSGTLVKGMREGGQFNQMLRLVFDMNSDVTASRSTIDPKTVVFRLKNKVPVTNPAPVSDAANVPDRTSTIGNKPVDNITEAAGKGISTSVQQDSLLLAVAQLKSYYSFNEGQAAAVELDGGPRVFRANGTYGLALNDNNRVKLSAEYLRENLDFDFYTGDTRQWVDQGAIGVSYQYLLGDDIFKNVEVGSHYSHAPNKNLSDKTVAYADGSSITDYRRIAGGDDWNGTGETALHLWSKSLLTVGADYDRVRYDTEYCTQDGHDAQGMGGHIRLEQLLKPDTQLKAESTVTQLFNSYALALNWIRHASSNTVVSAGLSSSYTQDHTTERNFWINGLNLNIIWDAVEAKKAQPSYAEPSVAEESLSTWVQTPAVRMPDVLAIADECVTQHPYVPVAGTCPSVPDLAYDSTTEQYYAPGGWYQFYPAGTAIVNANKDPYAALDSVNIMSTPSGEAACFYIVREPGIPSKDRLEKIILKNKRYRNVEPASGSGYIPGGAISQFWPNNSPQPAMACPAAIKKCDFITVSP